MAEGYNGWTNYETWAVKLWIDNEEPSYRYWTERAREAIKSPEPNQFAEGGHLSPEYTLAQQLKSEFEDMMPDLGASMWADLLNSAFSEVNWFEIAKSMIDGVNE